MKKKVLILVLTGLILSSIVVYKTLSKDNSKINPELNSKSVYKENNQETEKKIYNESLSQGMYKSDPTIPQNLLEYPHISIAKIKVKAIGNAEFLPKMKNYYDNQTPSTPITIEVIENLFGEKVKPTDNIIYMVGGDIKISDLITHLDSVDIDRLGFNKLSTKEKENQYMRYLTEYSYNLEVGKEYIVILNKMDEGKYKILIEGCGIFTEISEKSEKINLKNVITDKEITKEKLISEADSKKSS